ncbi:hypothetical protein [Halomicrobium katesii]|uniref:hypothetical protein n=1 Tax=Halomicrobium katesii TaxID=437163 RepID=UPI000374FF3B|nr:hypothetical protein [Halomicrobium katesii]
MSDLSERIVRQDIGIAIRNVTVGVMLAGTVAFAVDQWWISVVAIVVAGLLSASADRSRAGMWVLIAIGTVAILGLGWGMLRDTVPTGVLPLVLIGMGAGLALNRVLFGVLRPVPEVRQRREDAA